MTKRVVITGLGAITATGEGAPALWRSVSEGRSGIDWVRLDSGAGADWKIAAAVVRDFEPEKFVTQKKSLKVMARDIQLAVASASLAMDDAGAKDFAFDSERFGLIVGSGVLNHELEELVASVQNSMDEDRKLDLKKFGSEGLPALFPLWLLKYLPNMPACHISILFGLHGMNNTVTTGASAGLQAVGEAFHIIRRGDADLMLAGGAESKVNLVGLSQYKILGVLSELSEGDPKKNYRPFGTVARGVVIGEGAGFVVLEELEHAKKRGAKIYAEVAGFGSAASGECEGAMRSAILESGARPGEIGYLQACGLGLVEEDDLEARSIDAVFNGTGTGLSVSASKPVIGFTGFSSGALDLVISTMGLKEQTVPPFLNFSGDKDRHHFNVVSQTALKKKIGYAMTNALGLQSPAVSIVLKAVGDS